MPSVFIVSYIIANVIITYFPDSLFPVNQNISVS